MKKFYIKKNSKGFSLIEVLIAMVVMSFALMAIYSLFIRGTSDIDYGKRKTMATITAQEKMEELRSRSFSDPLLVSDNDAVSINNITMQREWIVTDVDTTLKRITVNVEWHSKTRNDTFSITSNKNRF